MKHLLSISWYRKVYNIYHCENCRLRLLPPACLSISRVGRKAIFLIAQEFIGLSRNLTSLQLLKHGFLICMVLSLNSVSVFAEAERDKFRPVDATVLTDKVNIRAGQGSNFEILGQLNKATEVVVIGQEYDWYKIKLPKEALCFVHRDYVKDGVVNANKLRVRAGAGDNFNVLGILGNGQPVSILAQNDDWLRIIPPDNCSGWVKKGYLQLSKKRFTSLHKKHQISKPVSAPQKKIKVWGIIDDLGKIVNRQGTHKLIEGKKTLYYLKGENIDLNHYVYQKVCVIGALVDLKNSPYPVINVEQIMVR